ncbi:uncharacterized protein [Aegilops tauschii subsp. strangulata]|uniref:uncharacterized protein n=1 Tax=Aegilops tauschii subsp. strangulata TaxID=200361 RepID=UPI003CC89742
MMLSQEELPPAPLTGAPAYGPTSGARLLLALTPQEDSWTKEFEAYLLHGTLPKKEEDVERVARQATTYCLQDGKLYCRRPNDVSLRCISEDQGHELLADINGGDCRHHSSSRTLMGKFTSNLFRSYCANLGTEICYTSVAHPRSNGQAERANEEILRGLNARSFKKKLDACGKGWLNEL